MLLDAHLSLHVVFSHLIVVTVLLEVGSGFHLLGSPALMFIAFDLIIAGPLLMNGAYVDRLEKVLPARIERVRVLNIGLIQLHAPG